MAFICVFGRLVRSTCMRAQASSCGHTLLYSTAVPEAQRSVVHEIKPFDDIPGPKGIYNLPFIGTMLHFKPFTKTTFATMNYLYDEMFDKYGPIFKWRLGMNLVMVCEPKDIETVFRNEGRYPIREGVPINKSYSERNNLKYDLADLSGEDWHALRAPLNKRMMKVDSAKIYLQPQNVVADDFIKTLASWDMSSQDLAEVFFRYTAESIGVICFNARLGLLDPDAFNNPETVLLLQASNDVFRYMHKAMSGESLIHNFYRNEVYNGFERARLLLRKNTLKHLKEAQLDLESRKRDGTFDPEEPNLLLSLLSDKSIDREDVINMIDSLYVAGTDSTAKNLQAFFYNLAKNPDKQEKLREEVTNAIGKDQPVTAETLSRMPYLKASLKESFRLMYPTLSGTRRHLSTDAVLSGFRVPAGTVVGLHNPKACRDHFTSPEKFIPERWLRSEGQLKEEIPMMASLPFGHGPKNCIGRRFAEQEMYLATAKMLQKLKIEVDPESSNTNFIYSLFIQPEKPIKFKFTKLAD